MREIKFRGKRVDNGEWSYSHYGFRKEILSTDESLDKIWFLGVKNSEHEVDKNTFTQFTGLCDKNGNDIFEGDVVKAFGEEYEIVWGADGNAEGYNVQGWGCKHLDGFMGTMTLRTKQNESVEVIGNIHENCNG